MYQRMSPGRFCNRKLLFNNFCKSLYGLLGDIFERRYKMCYNVYTECELKGGKTVIKEYSTYHYPDGDTFNKEKILVIIPRPMYASNHR